MENALESAPTLHNSKSLWALVIGIDNYEDNALTNLNGAVQDAKAMRDFLVKQHVPTEHIRMLTDGDATYTGIIKAFDEHLIINPDVRHGAPLLFYFAGYGSRYDQDLGRRWRQREAICPSDRNTAAASGTKNPDIMITTLRCLLATLAVVKGENITVILDCGHGPTIDTRDGLLRVRYAPPIQDAKTWRTMFGYPEDQGPLHTQGPLPSTTCSPTTRQGVRMAAKILDNRTKLVTHVLLAASQMGCPAYEKASKDVLRCSGLFTSALLLVLEEKLKKNRLDVLACCELIAEIQGKLEDPKGELTMQYARCEGKNGSRPLFAIHATRQSRRLASATFVGSRSGAQLRVDIGAIHGACQATEFDLWSDKSATKSCGKLTTEKVLSTYSLTKPSPEFEWQNGVEYFAEVSWWGNTDGLRVPIDIASDTDIVQDERQVFAECIRILRGDHRQHGIEVPAELVKPSMKREQPSVELQEPAGELQEPAARLEKPDARHEGPASGVEESAVAVNVQTPARKPAVPLISDVRDGMMRVKRSDPVTGVANIDFFCPTAREALRLLNRMLRFEMHLARTNPQHPLLGTLEIGFVRLPPIREGERMESNLFDKQHRALVPNDGAGHQFIIKNKGFTQLWVFVYYFDPVTYTVTKFYASKLGSPLEAGDKLSIGDVGNPLSFTMAEGLTMLDERHGLIYVNPYPNLSTPRGAMYAKTIAVAWS